MKYFLPLIKMFSEWLDKRNHKRESKTGFWCGLFGDHPIIHFMEHEALLQSSPSWLTQYLTASLYRFYGSSFIKLVTFLQTVSEQSLNLAHAGFFSFLFSIPLSSFLPEKLIFNLRGPYRMSASAGHLPWHHHVKSIISSIVLTVLVKQESVSSW